MAQESKNGLGPIHMLSAYLTNPYSGCSGFVSRCKEEFSKRCQTVIEVAGGENGPTIEVRCLSQNIQFRDLSYISRIAHHIPILSELYCDQPELLRRRVREYRELGKQKRQTLMSCGALYLYISNDPTKNPIWDSEAGHAEILAMVSARHQSLTLNYIKRIHHSTMGSQLHNNIFPTQDKRRVAEFLGEVYRDFIAQLQNSESFRQCFEKSSQAYNPSSINFPTICGWIETIWVAINQYLSFLQPKIWELSRLPDNTMPTSTLQKLEPSRTDPLRVLVIFAAAGSGKTKAISSLLHQMLGYYFLAGNVDPQRVSGSYEPRRSDEDESIHGSKDTWSLRQMLEDEMPPWETESLEAGAIIDALPWNLIKIARIMILNLFLAVASKEDPQFDDRHLPSRWFRLQTNCAHVDAFNDIFRLLSIMPKDLRNDQRYSPDDYNNQVKHVCIDEAQADLEVYVSRSKITINLLTGMLESWAGKILTVSGTSLDLRQAIKTIRSNKSFLPFLDPDTTGSIVSELPMVNTARCFENLLHQRNPNLKDRIERARMMPPVVKESIRFQGRYRWSTMFIDRLDKCSKIEGWSEALVIRAAQRTYDEAKKRLKWQLDKIESRRDPSSYRLIRDVLPFAAIWCQILDKPYRFENDEDINLVKYGFASVERVKITVSSDRLKANLVEKIAADALFEYLSERHQDLIEEKLLQVLNHLQDDAGGFGTKTEKLLSYELQKYLRLRDSTSLLGFDESRRSRIMDKFGTAANTSGGQLKSNIDLSEYFLVEGELISHKLVPGTPNSVEPWQWLESIRKWKIDPSLPKPRCSLLLPDESVGPDLMLVLEKQNAQTSAELVVCFIQLKTGTKKLYGKKREKALSSSAPNAFYSAIKSLESQGLDPKTLKNKKDNLLQELAEVFWRSAKKLSVLITTTQEAQNFSPDHLTDGYFLWIDETQTANIFGERCAQLLREVKNHEIP